MRVPIRDGHSARGMHVGISVVTDIMSRFEQISEVNILAKEKRTIEQKTLHNEEVQNQFKFTIS